MSEGARRVLAAWMLAPAGTRLPTRPNPGPPCFYPGSFWGQLEHLRLSGGRLKCFAETKVLREALRFLSKVPFFFLVFLQVACVIVYSGSPAQMDPSLVCRLHQLAILKLFFKAHFNKWSRSF